MILYFDSSSLVKLVQRESESAALTRFLGEHRLDLRVTSALARVEVVRAILPGGPAAIAKARRMFGRLYQIPLDTDLLDAAATLATSRVLRSLDAIHLATAGMAGADLLAVVTYDRRMADAAVSLGMQVDSPA